MQGEDTPVFPGGGYSRQGMPGMRERAEFLVLAVTTLPGPGSIDAAAATPSPVA